MNDLKIALGFAFVILGMLYAYGIDQDIIRYFKKRSKKRRRRAKA